MQKYLQKAALLPPNCFILGKRELTYIPLIGQFFTLGKNIIIDRSNRKSALETMSVVADRLAETNSSLWMYPEGTRSYQSNRTLLPFKKGAFHLAVQGKMPVVGVVVSTYSPFYDEKKYWFEPCVVHVKVLEPVYGTDVDELVKTTYTAMSQCLKGLETTKT